MRKKWNMVLWTVMVLSLAVSGCGEKNVAKGETVEGGGSTEAYIVKAQEKLDVSQSFVSTFHAQVDMGDGGGQTKTETTISMIREPLAVEMKSINFYDKQQVTSDIYMEAAGEDVNMFMAYDKQWTEMTLSKESARQSIGLYDVGSNMGLLLKMVPFWEETARDKDVITFQGLVPAEKVFEVSESGYFLQLAGMTGIGETYFTGVEAVPVEIKLKEDGTPLSYTADFSATLQKVLDQVLAELSGTDGAPLGAKEYIITQEIKQLDGLKSIEIPEEARDAINYEREIKLIESSSANE